MGLKKKSKNLMDELSEKTKQLAEDIRGIKDEEIAAKRLNEIYKIMQSIWLNFNLLDNQYSVFDSVAPSGGHQFKDVHDRLEEGKMDRVGMLRDYLKRRARKDWDRQIIKQFEIIGKSKIAKKADLNHASDLKFNFWMCVKSKADLTLETFEDFSQRAFVTWKD
jgi:hypothetical protein